MKCSLYTCVVLLDQLDPVTYRLVGRSSLANHLRDTLSYFFSRIKVKMLMDLHAAHQEIAPLAFRLTFVSLETIVANAYIIKNWDLCVCVCTHNRVLKECTQCAYGYMETENPMIRTVGPVNTINRSQRSCTNS